LPSHDVYPLVEDLTVGRATPGLIGATLQLFEHVHNEHVRFDVTGDVLTVRVLDEKNPVFVYRGMAEDAWLDLGELPPGPPGLALRAGDGPRTLCLGQCCFIRLGRVGAD
jgi:hypothetical protein